jgi:hypothetical protein
MAGVILAVTVLSGDCVLGDHKGRPYMNLNGL